MTPARAGLGEAGCRAARRREAVYRRWRAGFRRLSAASGERSAWRKRRWGRGRSGRLSRPDLGLRMVHNASTPARMPSPVGLSTLLVHSSTRLAIPSEVVVLCTMHRRDRARPLPLPGAFYRAARHPGLRARSDRGPRVDSHQARRYTASRLRAARHPASPIPARAGVIRLRPQPSRQSPHPGATLTAGPGETA
jgi:hypothetical protein